MKALREFGRTHRSALPTSYRSLRDYTIHAGFRAIVLHHTLELVPLSASEAPRRAPSPVWLRVRHTSAVLALAAAPLAGVAWSFLVPLFTGRMSDEVAAVAAAPSRFVVGTFLGVVMSFLMVPAALALGRFLRPLAPVWSDVATWLCVLGAFFHGCVLVFQLAEAGVIASMSDQAQATTVVTKLFEQQGFALVLAPFLAFYLGLAAFALLLLVRRAVSWWIPLLILVSIPTELAGPMIWKARAFFIMLALAFGGLAYAVWRLGSDEWARR